MVSPASHFILLSDDLQIPRSLPKGQTDIGCYVVTASSNLSQNAACLLAR